VDIDGDGHRDILSGSYSRMEPAMAGVFQVLYGKPDGTFRKAEVLKGTDGEPLIIPLNGQPMTENICTRPFAVDWDGDGHLDLVVGNFAGTFYWFKGEGKGKFRPKPEVIKSGNEPLRIEGHHSDPFVIDLDGDGDLDLVSGSATGGVQWAENIAGKGKPPVLRPFRMLIKPAPSVEYGQPLSEDELAGPTSATRVWVADVNGDGKLDLLVGDSVTLIAPAKGLSAEEFKKKFTAWQNAVATASKELSSETADQAKRTKAAEEFNKVYNQRAEFMKEDRTGFVWLYLQK
jgi:FG-GAP-like repeat